MLALFVFKGIQWAQSDTVRWNSQPNLSIEGCRLAFSVFATTILAVLAIAFTHAGIKGAANRGNPWSHGLCISVLWSGVTALLAARIYRDYGAGAVVGLLVFSHWALDLISYPSHFRASLSVSWQ